MELSDQPVEAARIRSVIAKLRLDARRLAADRTLIGVRVKVDDTGTVTAEKDQTLDPLVQRRSSGGLG